MWKNIKDSFIIPKKFTVGGSTYNIEIVDSDKNIDGALGDFTDLKHRIRVAKTYSYEGYTLDIPNDEFIKTYLHELGHCFSYYFNGDQSEEFACAFANFFYEYLITKE